MHVDICQGGFLESSSHTHNCVPLKDLPRAVKNITRGLVVDDLAIDYETTMWISVDGRERPFDATGHYPILAGFNASGEACYVALAESKGGS